TAAARIAWGFRSLFNNPEARCLVEEAGTPYWRRVLRYCIDGNLQAVLDEYVHVLHESLGLMDHAPEAAVMKIASAVESALSIRASRLGVEEFRSDSDSGVRVHEFRMRCRFALRYGDIRGSDDKKVLARAGGVRAAFNSPFWPFVLASTSIGQEGLDFHPFCHQVWHWNLPRNPVDMEQREGRVHRYKGHAVRKNVARAVDFGGLAEAWDRESDPWACLFTEAARLRPHKGSELHPYWIFEDVDDPARIERRVPTPPLSRDEHHYARLKRSLAIYRLAFGQPRQEDLLSYLQRMDDDAADRLTGRRLSLAPK
ncbi:MAG: C-terminal helicase domain-containing protein, partial [Myxococcota bacterium]